jgi:hypothetical protein
VITDVDVVAVTITAGTITAVTMDDGPDARALAVQRWWGAIDTGR